MRRVWNRLFNLTGFRGKTLWDLLGLLIIPVVIALVGWWLSEVSTRNQQQIETDRAQQSVLQSYIQDMTELLLDKGLATSKPDSLITQVARANTLSAIHRLDSGRNGILLEFLSDSNLLSSGSVTMLRGANLSEADLRGADLSGADLSEADLRGANLEGAFLNGADLSFANLDYAYPIGADLRDANLSGANLEGAFLNGANLEGADLSGANLSMAPLAYANLSGANLRGANLSNASLPFADLSGASLRRVRPNDVNQIGINSPGTNLSGADLSYTNLTGADLSDANLSEAYLEGADLTDAILIGANLSGANIEYAEEWNNKQLAQAESLVGATMPNGTVMTKEAWEEFKKRYRAGS